jgi:hypothetical protein
MKNALLLLLLFTGIWTQSQSLNNEWINYAQTYYKFKVGKTGLYRISGSTLATAGLGSVNAQHFQLWRNGVQVPVYTSVASGSLSPADYIEFWGEMNDGKPERQLYRNPDFQLNDKWSLHTDTAVYFLTVNTAGNNLRLLNTANNVAGNTLPAEPYFMHTAGVYYKDKMSQGMAVHVGEYLYSSAYDRGEGWTSGDIAGGNSTGTSLTNLYVYNNGPNAKFKIAVSGNAIKPRTYRVRINGDSVLGNQLIILLIHGIRLLFP